MDAEKRNLPVYRVLEVLGLLTSKLFSTSSS